MLFHVDVDLGIKSILMYSLGLTCQKVHLVNHKKSSVFVCFPQHSNSKMISPASLRLCPLFSVSVHLTLWWKTFTLSVIWHRTDLWTNPVGGKTPANNCNDESMIQYGTSLTLHYIIITSQCRLWWRMWMWMHEVSNHGKRGFCANVCVFIMDVSLSICVSDCVHIFIT